MVNFQDIFREGHFCVTFWSTAGLKQSPLSRALVTRCADFPSTTICGRAVKMVFDFMSSWL